MLGKRNHRVRAFSTCHAAVLAAFIVLAHLLALVSPSERVQLSGQDVIVPAHPGQALLCEQTGDSGLVASGCAALLRTTQEEAGGSATPGFGLNL